MKVAVRISVSGRTGVARKSFDENPSREAVMALVDDAMAQTLEEYAKPAKKKVAKKKASKKTTK